MEDQSMEAAKVIRHIIGYGIGITLFGIIIPSALIKFSRWGRSYIELEIFNQDWLRLGIAFLVLAIGVFFALWSNAALFTIGKGGPTDGFNVAISPRTEKLVITGPYRYTRNPMVFGAYMCYFSIAMFMNSIACLGLLILFYCLTIPYLKSTEEKRLFKDFGNDFLDYKKRVPMIIPFPKIKK
jgi:protein-S-isoprenylcysteine O-methyltransferase Ste14